MEINPDYQDSLSVAVIRYVDNGWYDFYRANSPEYLREQLRQEKKERKGKHRFRTIAIVDGVNYKGKNRIKYLIRSLNDSGGASKKVVKASLEKLLR